MGFYDDDIAGAKEDIQLNGQACVWHLKPDDEDATKSWEDDEAATPTDKDVFIAFFPIDQRDISSLAATNVKNVVFKGLMSADYDFEPALTDSITRGDMGDFQVGAISPLRVNEQPIIYTIYFQSI